MYQILYDQKTSKVLLEVNDKSKYSFENHNLYCLELSVPAYLGKGIQKIGLQQLESFSFKI